MNFSRHFTLWNISFFLYCSLFTINDMNEVVKNYLRPPRLSSYTHSKAACMVLAKPQSSPDVQHMSKNFVTAWFVLTWWKRTVRGFIFSMSVSLEPSVDNEKKSFCMTSTVSLEVWCQSLIQSAWCFCSLWCIFFSYCTYYQEKCP